MTRLLVWNWPLNFSPGTCGMTRGENQEMWSGQSTGHVFFFPNQVRSTFCSVLFWFGTHQVFDTGGLLNYLNAWDLTFSRCGQPDSTFPGLFPRGSTTYPCVPQVVSLFNAFRLFSMEWVLRQRPIIFGRVWGGQKQLHWTQEKGQKSSFHFCPLFFAKTIKDEKCKSQKPNH